MKKILKCLLTILLIVPILVNASSFGDAKQIANNYQSKFLTPDRYIIPSTNFWGLDGNMKPIKINGFSTGGLIAQKEIEITRKSSTNPMSFSYVYDGTKIWTIENKIVSENFISGSNAKTKVTEYVKHDTTVSGIGTKEDPWIFLDSYRVTVKAKAHGKIQVGSEEPTISKTQVVRTSAPVSFNIISETGWKYANHTCGSSAKVENNVITFSSVEKDMVCEVEFAESRDSVTLPTPCFTVSTKFGTNSRCFSDPVNNQFFYRYGLGYYNDENLTVRVGKFTSLPARTGWTFDGYFVGTTEFISPSGVYETSYTLINENNKNIVAKGHANEYTITYDKQGGKDTVGERTLKVLYEHDLPSIVRPQREGYVFDGYFTGKNGTGTKYYNADGSAAKIWEEPGNTTLYAKWKICSIDYFCPGDNSENHCPTGYGTDGAYGTISCSQCKYWDKCKEGHYTCVGGWDYTGGYDCKGGYDQLGCSYTAGSCAGAGGSFYQTSNTTMNGSGCCKKYNSCASTVWNSQKYKSWNDCKTGEDTCVAGWVNNTNQCITPNSVTVSLIQQTPTSEGATSYVATYYGDRVVVTPESFTIPAKDGYVFDGYYTQSDGKGTKVVSMISSTTGKVIVPDIVNSGATKSGNNYILYAYYVPCTKGHFCKNNDSNPCDEGQYQNETGKSSCKVCPAGTYADVKGSTVCSKCSTGTYQDGTGKTVCKECPAGQYQDEEGKTSCKTCIKGSMSYAVSSYCIACNNGKTTTGNGSTTCDANCSNNSNVASWKNAVWNSDNTITDLCKIDTCSSGYTNSDNTCADTAKPTCTVTKSDTGTTSGVTTTVTCSDVGTGCKTNNPTGDTGLTSSKTYTVYDNAGNSGTCSVSVTPQIQSRSRTWNNCLTCVGAYVCSSWTTGANASACGTTSYYCYKCCPRAGTGGGITYGSGCDSGSYSVCGYSTYCSTAATCTYCSGTYYWDPCNSCTAGWNAYGSWGNVSSCSADDYTQCRTLYN